MSNSNLTLSDLLKKMTELRGSDLHITTSSPPQVRVDGHLRPLDFEPLTVVADLLYRCLAERLRGFAQASPYTLFRKFVDNAGSVRITAEEIVVRLSKRAHNPLVQEAGLTRRTQPVPWLGGRCVRVECP